MTKREIVRLVLAGKRPPYVPWHFGFTEEARQTLEQQVGSEGMEPLLQNHLLDLGAEIGFFDDIGNERVRDVLGVVWDRSIDKDIGMVQGCVLPEPTLHGYEFPNPRDPRFFADIPDRLARHGDRWRVFQVGFSLYERAWTLRGLENLLMDFLDHPAFVRELLNAIADYNLAQIEEALRYDIDAVYFGDDWGQRAACPRRAGAMGPSSGGCSCIPSRARRPGLCLAANCSPPPMRGRAGPRPSSASVPIDWPATPPTQDGSTSRRPPASWSPRRAASSATWAFPASVRAAASTATRGGACWSAQWREGRGGVWRYTPETRRWDRLLDDDQAFACQADPSDSTRLLLVTTMDPFYDQARGNGVWISGDDGVSWSPANEGLPMLRANACAFDPFDPEQIVVGTNGMGFFRARWPKDHLPAGTRRYATTDEDRQAASLAPDVAARVLVSLVAAPDNNRNLLANGDMSAGSDRPNGWGETWGAAKAFRDTTVFRSAPASLRVEVAGGTGQAFQLREGGADATLRVRGALRSQGDVRAQVAVQAFDAEWKRNEFKQIRYIQGDTDWVAFEGTVTLPEWTARYNVQIWAEGKGQAWLDDAFLAAIGASAAEVGPPATVPGSSTRQERAEPGAEEMRRQPPP